MKLIKFSFYLVLSLILLSSNVIVRAEGVDGKKGKVLNKTTGTPGATKFNINNISTFFGNDGISDLSTTGDSGFQFPIGSGKTVFYESGFLYGGYVNGEWRVGGSTYSRGQVPGRIVTPGTVATPLGIAEAAALPQVRIYRVRRDYKDPQADYSKEIMDESKTKDAIYTQYDKDWKEWPAIYGAPFEDKNNNKTYEPAIDIPGVPGADQTIWFVANDVDPTTAQKLYGSIGLGIEMQATIWGYNQQNALGDALFRKYTMINKGFYPVDSCYVNMWSDPDLGGDAGDDFAGCDTLLSLGFIYNGDDSDPSYGSYIPSAGFDFMQGPIIKGSPTDKAIFKGKFRAGYKNMPMTAFYLFTQGVANWGDPTLGSYPNGALRFRNLFQGKNATLGTPFIDPLTGKKSMFFAPGDPVTGTGWIDGILFPKQDRRIGAVSGPFTLAVGDTQEVVVAQLAAGGVAPISRLGAVALLKFQDLQAQQAYNNFFNVPNPPKAPLVPLDPVTKIGKASEFDQKLIISWADDLTAYNLTESHNELGYKFQGYVVYQLPRLNAQLNEGVVVATYDLIDLVGNIESLVFDPATNNTTKKFTKSGTNSGIQRYISITTDKIRGGIPLANGTEYYFVVSAYSFNPDPQAVPNVLETLSARISAIPHAPDPGVSYQGKSGVVLSVNHSAGSSDGIVTPFVVDPSKVDGSEYTVTFGAQAGKTIWNLLKGSQSVLSNQTHFGTDKTFAIVNGVQVGVQDAPPQIKGPGEGDGMVEVAYAGTPLPSSKWDPAGTPFSGNKVWHSLNSSGGDRYVVSSNAGGTIDRLYRWVTYASPHDYELRFTDKAAYGVYAFKDDKICTVPFELWDIGIGTPNDKTDDIRMMPLILENVSTSDKFGWGTATDGYFGAYPMSDAIYWMDAKDKTKGDKGYKQFENSCVKSGGAGATYNYAFDTDPAAGDYNMDFHGGFVYPIGRMTLLDFDKDGKWPPAGTVIRLNYTKPITTSDVYKFTAPSVITNDLNLAKDEVEKINVFPNPYYGANPREVNKYQRFVTFSHLPQKATLRIFNLAGQLVRIIQKDSPSQFTTWDLVNDSSFPVASGLYIVHIDMPDLGKTKIVKLAVIQEQQILDHF